MNPQTQQRIPALNALLADYQVFWQRLRARHWMVQGPHFFQLHGKFQELYEEAAGHADAVAERVLALGGTPPTALADMLAAARIQESPVAGDARAMVEETVAELEGLITRLREAAAAAAGDEATVNLLTGMADGHEQELWMLRAWLGG